MSDLDDLHESLEAVQRLLQPLKEGEFAERINKVSVYLASIEKSWNMYSSAMDSIRQQMGGDEDTRRKAIQGKVGGLRASISSSIKFARMNLDQAMDNALDKLMRRPIRANKTDESKRIQSLQKWFDELPDPTNAMFEHFKNSSNPLDKYLLVGQWGHQYLRKRHINSEAFDRQICEVLSCSDSVAGRIVLSYGKIVQAIDVLEEMALKLLP